MANLNTSRQWLGTLKRGILSWLLPRIVELPPREWDSAARQAKNVELDWIETVWLIGGVAFVTYLLRFDPEQEANISAPMRYLGQFVAAFPLLIIVVGPAYLRRARRGLDTVIAAYRSDRRANH
ncbi:MAG: hypothetical protein Q8K23_05240 [Sulfuritalea sp.]|jgi:hypothetical protein|nr:hypothetical protein [Sulfuritalea sp.]